MLKSLFLVTTLILISGCTTRYTIDYLVTTSDQRGITAEDVKVISESLADNPGIDLAVHLSTYQTDSPNLPNAFYLSRHIDAQEVLRVRTDKDDLIFSVSRVTKYLGDFSDTWKAAFKFRFENIITRTTEKSVTLQEMSGQSF